MTEIIKQIEAVINTLNKVEVKGMNNLDRLLASMQVLQDIHDKLIAKDGEENG